MLTKFDTIDDKVGIIFIFLQGCIKFPPPLRGRLSKLFGKNIKFKSIKSVWEKKWKKSLWESMIQYPLPIYIKVVGKNIKWERGVGL